MRIYIICNGCGLFGRLWFSGIGPHAQEVVVGAGEGHGLGRVAMLFAQAQQGHIHLVEQAALLIAAATGAARLSPGVVVRRSCVCRVAMVCLRLVTH